MIETPSVLEALSLDLGWPSYQKSTVERWNGTNQTMQLDYVAEEVPVSLVYNGIPHVVMLVTPTNLEEFALGFSVTEGIIKSAKELLSTRIYNRSNGIEVHCQIPQERFVCLSDKGRNLAGRTGCGLCGASTLEQAVRKPGHVTGSFTLPADELITALADLKQHQQLNQLTGSVHAAAWAIPGQGVVEVREDVGRHNALDKLIGLLLRTGRNFTEGFVIITSRASFEMIQKAAFVGINILAAISAPTGLAIRLAEETGLTLIGFARKDQYVVYTHSQRLTHSPFLNLTEYSL